MDSLRSQTEHLSLSELLGENKFLDQPPTGWKHPKLISKIPDGSKVYAKNLRTGQWEQGEVLEYWERGRFLQVRCGQRLQKVFIPEHLATNQLVLIM